jgi:tRNA(Ile)-lysidine synthase
VTSDLPERFHAHLATLGLEPGPAIVAVSGGPDSVALLQLLAGKRHHGLELTVAHVDHGIHPESAAVALKVERLAAALQLPCLVTRLDLGNCAGETEAREARYQVLHAIARERGALLVTAHHRDDQVETVLLRVLGGSGPAGLAGMATRSGRLVRPLLPFGRDEIRSWLVSTGSEFWDDPANVDPRNLRSWLRTELLPRIASRIPDAASRLERVGRMARSNRRAWDAVLELLPIDLRYEGAAISLSIRGMALWPDGLTSEVLQAAARRAGWVLGPIAARRVVHLIRQGESGRRVDLTGGRLGELAFDRVLLRADQAESPWEALIQGESGETTCGAWRCRWQRDVAPAVQDRAALTAWLPPGEYQVRPWRTGDKILPLGGTGRRLVVRCMQDARIARHERAGWPVVVQHQQLVWVPGIMRSAHAIPKENESALRIGFEK